MGAEPDAYQDFRRPKGIPSRGWDAKFGGMHQVHTGEGMETCKVCLM